MASRPSWSGGRYKNLLNRSRILRAAGLSHLFEHPSSNDGLHGIPSRNSPVLLHSKRLVPDPPILVGEQEPDRIILIIKTNGFVQVIDDQLMHVSIYVRSRPITNLPGSLKINPSSFEPRS